MGSGRKCVSLSPPPGPPVATALTRTASFPDSYKLPVNFFPSQQLDEGSFTFMLLFFFYSMLTFEWVHWAVMVRNWTKTQVAMQINNKCHHLNLRSCKEPFNKKKNQCFIFYTMELEIQYVKLTFFHIQCKGFISSHKIIKLTSYYRLFFLSSGLRK